MIFRWIQQIFSQLFSDPISLLLQIISVLFALTIHEYAHAYVANKCGDPTAKYMGRLTLNPLKHLDPIGTISLLLFRFGWAKPVPVNSRNFNNYRRDNILVSAAGIVTNFVMYLLTRFLYLWIGNMGITNNFQSQFFAYFLFFLSIFGTLNLGLAIFNLLPIPPYDGFHLFNDIFFKGRIYVTQRHMQIIQMVVIVLIFSKSFSFNKISSLCLESIGEIS
ncbi:MAG: site-2 protease family protein [Clostridiales bacterium]|nr:site-2 protease family protein [Clostridiales bacterium]